ncbi:hypothetical protein BH23BAC4_BH23BAC4_11590 [soil metagenome]
MTSLPFVIAQADGGFNASFLLMMAAIFAVFYFFIIRPQKKREDTRKAMIGSVAKGDKIVTIGGVHGVVTRVDDATVLAQVDDTTKLRIDKNAIASVGKKDGA